MDRCAKIEDLVGKTLVSIERSDPKDGDDRIIFEADDGQRWLMYHDQDCCEQVEIVDICGDLNDLIGSPIQLAEEVSYKDENPEGVNPPQFQDCFTWTFYKIATVKGRVTIRWYGESNGYYSERVDFVEIA